AVFYLASAAAFLAVLRRFEVHTLWGVVLAAPIYAYVTEGVLTPVLYSGGPTPFFPVWFTAWHGLISMALLFVVVRWWAIEQRTGSIAGLSVVLGLFTGTWLITSLAEHQLQDPDLVAGHGVLVPMEPWDFARYAVLLTAFLLGAHLLLNAVWPRRPDRLLVGRSERLLTGFLLVGAAAWTVAAPWALPMFVGLCWLQFRVLAAHRDGRPAAAPTLLESLGAHASARSLLPLVLVAPSAALAYWGWWQLEPSQTMLDVLYYGVIVAQTLVAAVVLVQAWRRTGGRSAPRRSTGVARRHHVVASALSTPGSAGRRRP
ncbi:MAG: hypothetical protein AAGG08_16295, partial [Actinomycetota bacterium]